MLSITILLKSWLISPVCRDRRAYKIFEFCELSVLYIKIKDALTIVLNALNIDKEYIKKKNSQKK